MQEPGPCAAPPERLPIQARFSKGLGHQQQHRWGVPQRSLQKALLRWQDMDTPEWATGRWATGSGNGAPGALLVPESPTQRAAC